MVTQAASARAVCPATDAPPCTRSPMPRAAAAAWPRTAVIRDPQAAVQTGIPSGLGLSTLIHIPFGFPVPVQDVGGRQAIPLVRAGARLIELAILFLTHYVTTSQIANATINQHDTLLLTVYTLHSTLSLQTMIGARSEHATHNPHGDADGVGQGPITDTQPHIFPGSNPACGRCRAKQMTGCSAAVNGGRVTAGPITVPWDGVSGKSARSRSADVVKPGNRLQRLLVG